MQKIFSLKQIREADAYTITKEDIASVDLMERAALSVFNYLNENFQHEFYEVYCGQGNNGGDGIALARLLANVHKKVRLHIIKEKEQCSLDFESNFKRLEKSDDLDWIILKTNTDFAVPKPNAIIIDALLGTGLKLAPQGLVKEAIEFVNAQNNLKIAVDVPSGLLCDEPTLHENIVVKADITLSFQFMKLAYLFPENYKFTGLVKLLNIGLSPAFIQKEKTKHFFIDHEAIRSLMPKREHFAHKGNFGHALLLVGSKGKNGAALLASKACLRSGTGLLTVHSGSLLQNAPNCFLPSAMFNADAQEDMITELPELSKYTAIGAGCGIGQAKETIAILKLLIQQCKVPLLLDADGLNILAENKTWLSFLPNETILTPHPKEFERLCGKWSNSFERLQLQKDFSFKYNCYVVFKGAYTCISTPLGNCYFNSTGNPGMAKGGSGDVLAGIITALLAQGKNPTEAIIFGVYIHGLAGDLAKKSQSEVSMLPEDLIEHLGQAFISVQSNH
jgi:NAD(P)H-hydrate epimerase